MSKGIKATMEVKGTAVIVLAQKENDYIPLTDIARYKNAEHTDDLIRNWLRNRNTIEFPGVWERLNNHGFNPVESDGIRIQAGLNSFTLTPKQWIEKTGAVGIVSRAGQYGGTFAHKDITFKFAAWISVEFLGVGESVNNPDFNYGEFATIRSRALAPKARFYPSLGQRPRNANKPPIRAESPSH